MNSSTMNTTNTHMSKFKNDYRNYLGTKIYSSKFKKGYLRTNIYSSTFNDNHDTNLISWPSIFVQEKSFSFFPEADATFRFGSQTLGAVQEQWVG